MSKTNYALMIKHSQIIQLPVIKETMVSIFKMITKIQNKNKKRVQLFFYIKIVMSTEDQIGKPEANRAF